MSETRAVYISNSGVPATGLTLTWESLLKVSDGSAFTPEPTFTEVGGGWYKFDSDVGIDEQLAGVIDAGATILNESERYVPALLGDSDIARETECICTPIYDEDSDTIQFIVFLIRNGQVVSSDSVVVSVYDSTHNLEFTESGSSSTNDVFILAKNSPGLSSGEGYYIKAVITVGSVTFTSIETMLTLD